MRYWFVGPTQAQAFDPRYTYKGESDTSIQMAGLGANAISSELTLLIPKKRWGPYLNGVLISNALYEFIYPIFRHTWRDFKPLSHEERWTWGSIFVVHSLLTTYRIYKAGLLNFQTWDGSSEKGMPVGGFKITW